jgi:hypothetical protein
MKIKAFSISFQETDFSEKKENSLEIVAFRNEIGRKVEILINTYFHNCSVLSKKKGKQNPR